MNKYSKQRLQWFIVDYKGNGCTTRDEANLAQLVLDLVRTGDALRIESVRSDSFEADESYKLIENWDEITEILR